ncbi:hypothetical protein HGO53_05665 [Wolbachia endosymbiont of Diaphorina citri]|nr:hypothetical protein HGO49_04955 [Wolbachia endosymbiont of Diaphorina citri]QJT97615.1 hypothetical protein HGO53_05665 [Wolbachia endosymbiont of Diaphorina citri]QLK12096.1 hypothetical protein FK497_05015 [Wolbachia endosymbiont of Diaphorina citri]QXY87621.1 hypothetical protein GZ064_02590 [Wolbachia endosymbiont of Diaphorina citri]QXY88823.1 hypothetical protein GZ065_02650 [Wolbachia endosymbiont of Diaphorina citri]
MYNLKSAYPEKLKIGAAIKTGDCFFDSVAQGLNELNIKPDHYFTAKSLRKDCADYVEQHGEQDSWAYKAVIKDAAIGGYFVALEGPYGPIQNPKTKINMIDEKKTFHEYLKNIKNMATGAGSAPIWGRLEIEGKMICEKYKVKIEVIALEEEPIDGRYITTGEEGEGDKVVRIVNYMRHFVPLLSEISEDITESQPVSNEEIFGEVTEASASDQSEQEEQYNIRTSKAAIAQDHKEQKTQKERIDTSASEPIHTDTVITISHPHEQKTQQEEIQKKLINSYRREAIYSIAAVITAIAFTASAIAAVFTQPMPLACFAGVALVVACICAYQLTQSHQDINELKGKVGENNTFTFLEETGFKIYSLIDKAASKI